MLMCARGGARWRNWRDAIACNCAGIPNAN
jgi:hypothetical protein